MASAAPQPAPAEPGAPTRGADSRTGGGGGGGAGAGGGRALAGSLSGRLPCIKCRYDLKSLSILGDCPECGTAVRATILAVVDPMARELTPIRSRWLVATGLVLWAGCALGAVLVAWSLSIGLLVRVWVDAPVPVGPVGPAGPGVGGVAVLGWVAEHAGALLAGLIWAAGVGLLAVSRPNRQTPLAATVATVAAAALCAPLGLLAAEHASTPTAGTPGGFALASLWSAQGWAAWQRLVIAVLVMAVLLLFRPIARQLVRRSLALRTGRADRQTLVAMVAAVGLFALGECVGLLGTDLGRRAAAAAELTGRGMFSFALAFMVLGALLLTIGLAGALVECVHIARAIVWPGPALGEVVDLGNTGASAEAPTPRAESPP